MNTWKQITPVGASSVSILALRGEIGTLPIRDSDGKIACWPRPREFGVRLLCDSERVVDEAIVLGTQGGAELHVHGGAGSVQAVQKWLMWGKFEPAGVDMEATPRSRRHAWALLSAELGPLAPLRRRIREFPVEIHVLTDLPEQLRWDLARCLGQQTLGERMTTAPIVAIVGKPNAGKSTLFNALVGRDRALTAPEIGTTRDAVGALVELNGVAVELYDTAGCTPSMAPFTEADLLVHLLSEADEPCWPKTPSQAVLAVLGHADRRVSSGIPTVSGKTGAGVQALLDLIAQELNLAGKEGAELWAPADGELRRCLWSGVSR